jgi:DNA helicase-2/ATP-dependent DNA helicase PcrA
MDLSELNEEQRKAVLTTEGPILVLAGAGSGKTKVLTTKIAYLIEECGVPAYNILAITFTNKAAGEMKERVIKLIGEKANSAQISTFHSFGVRIIRENASLLGYTNNFSILDQNDSISVIKKILKEMNLSDEMYDAKRIKYSISDYKNQLMMPEDLNKLEHDNVIIDVYKKYDAILKKSNSVDFDDLLLLPIKLFKEYPNVLSRYQEKFRDILIDEYQDTNEVQYNLTKMISAKYKNICCVGDNDQSIYSFRGANYRNILNF